jgi:TolB-like protein
LVSPSVLGSEQTVDVATALVRDDGSPTPPDAAGRTAAGLKRPAPSESVPHGTSLASVHWVGSGRDDRRPRLLDAARWVPGGRVTLAVLPFDNVGGDPAHEYLATSLTQETSASLAQIDPEHLSVKGRTWRYKGTIKTAAEIGRELSVDYLVESTIRSEGGRVRVTATLLRVRDQEHVWSESYEREPNSLLGLEQELSRALAEQIRGRLSPNQVGSALRQTQNAEAYDACISKAGERPRRMPRRSRSTSVRPHSIQTTPSPGPVWRSSMRGASSMVMPAPSMSGIAPERLPHTGCGRIRTLPRRGSPQRT